MALRVKVKTRLRVNVKRASAKERAGAVRGLGMAAEHLLAESQKVVPIEESTLMRSGTSSVDAGALEAAVSYDTVYAARQHEELTWRHDPGRTAKYLENPYNAEADTMRKIIAAQIRRALR